MIFCLPTFFHFFFMSGSMPQREADECIAQYAKELPHALQVSSYAEFLSSIADKESRRRFLETAEQAGLDVASITKQVVEATRRKGMQQQLSDAAADITALATSSVKEMEGESERKMSFSSFPAASLTLVFPPPLPPQRG